MDLSFESNAHVVCDLYAFSPPPTLPQVISLANADILREKLGSIVPGIIRGYCHSESSVRKGSVFCLVALHSVVGEDIREHLTKLSSSQVSKLCTRLSHKRAHNKQRHTHTSTHHTTHTLTLAD